MRSVSVSNALYNSIRMVLVKGAWQPTREGYHVEDYTGADVMMVSPDYFHTLGISLVAGRGFSTADNVDAPRVAAVNQTLAAMLFTDRDPIGQHLSMEQSHPQEPTFEVVGIVGDSRTFGLGFDVRPQIYVPLPQIVPQIRGVTRAFTIALKTKVSPLSLAGTLRSEIWRIDEQLAVSKLQTMASGVLPAGTAGRLRRSGGDLAGGLGRRNPGAKRAQEC